MASLGDVGEALRRVLVKIDQATAAHHEAAELAEQARDLLSVASFGTLQSDVPDAAGTVRYDLQGQEALVPASAEVPLDAVRAVLAAYFEHGGLIPGDFSRLHEVE